MQKPTRTAQEIDADYARVAMAYGDLILKRENSYKEIAFLEQQAINLFAERMAIGVEMPTQMKKENKTNGQQESLRSVSKNNQTSPQKKTRGRPRKEHPGQQPTP